MKPIIIDDKSTMKNDRSKMENNLTTRPDIRWTMNTTAHPVPCNAGCGSMIDPIVGPEIANSDGEIICSECAGGLFAAWRQIIWNCEPPADSNVKSSSDTGASERAQEGVR